MNKILLTTLLMSLSSTAFAQTEPTLPPALMDMLNKEQAGSSGPASAPDIKPFLDQVDKQVTSFTNTLTALNNKIGYDPTAYQFIVYADALVDQMKATEGTVKSAALSIGSNQNKVEGVIQVLNNMTPSIPSTPPGRCAGSIGEYIEVTGFIDKGYKVGSWVLKSFDGSSETPISADVGLIGQGTLINPSYTPSTTKETGWIDKTTKQVVCLSTGKL